MMDNDVLCWFDANPRQYIQHHLFARCHGMPFGFVAEQRASHDAIESTTNDGVLPSVPTLWSICEHKVMQCFRWAFFLPNPGAFLSLLICRTITTGKPVCWTNTRIYVEINPLLTCCHLVCLLHHTLAPWNFEVLYLPQMCALHDGEPTRYSTS